MAGFTCDISCSVARFAERRPDHELSGYATVTGANSTKLDFSEGIPNDCVTLVAVPAVLLNEQQVRKLADDLEVRYLGNQDANISLCSALRSS